MDEVEVSLVVDTEDSYTKKIMMPQFMADLIATNKWCIYYNKETDTWSVGRQPK